jgi:hypothetical protein
LTPEKTKITKQTTPAKIETRVSGSIDSHSKGRCRVVGVPELEFIESLLPLEPLNHIAKCNPKKTIVRRNDSVETWAITWRTPIYGNTLPFVRHEVRTVRKPSILRWLFDLADDGGNKI